MQAGCVGVGLGKTRNGTCGMLQLVCVYRAPPTTTTRAPNPPPPPRRCRSSVRTTQHLLSTSLHFSVPVLCTNPCNPPPPHTHTHTRPPAPQVRKLLAAVSRLSSSAGVSAVPEPKHRDRGPIPDITPQVGAQPGGAGVGLGSWVGDTGRDAGHSAVGIWAEAASAQSAATAGGVGVTTGPPSTHARSPACAVVGTGLPGSWSPSLPGCCLLI